jgi:hypothetical protein
MRSRHGLSFLLGLRPENSRRAFTGSSHTWSHVLSDAPTALRSRECDSRGGGTKGGADGSATHEIYEISC